MDDANGGIGDELDGISLRDLSAVRYVRHHEWLELVVGTAIPTHQIQIPKIFTPIDATNSSPWSFNDSESVKAKLESIEKEIKELNSQSTKGWIDNPEEASKSEFYRKTISKLREDFGLVSADEDYSQKLVKEVEDKFGLRVIDKKRLRRVGVDIDLDQELEQDGKKLKVDDSDVNMDDNEGDEDVDESDKVAETENEQNVSESVTGVLASIPAIPGNPVIEGSNSATSNTDIAPDAAPASSEEPVSIAEEVKSTENYDSSAKDSGDLDNSGSSVDPSAPGSANPDSSSIEPESSSNAQGDLLSLEEPLQDGNILLDQDALAGLDDVAASADGQDIDMEGTNFDDSGLGDVLGSLPEA